MKRLLWNEVVLLSALVLSCGGNASDDSKTFVLTVSAAHGAVRVEPLGESYSAGTTVTLTAVGDTGYEFTRWSGAEAGGLNPLVIVMDGDHSVTANFSAVEARDYYVDYAYGSDENSGTSTTDAWKHAPGDPLAEGIPAEKVILPGNRVLLRGGVVYRGQIAIPSSGSIEHPVIYSGSEWPGAGELPAVIDGGDPVTGWRKCASAAECGGNVHWQNVYRTTVSESANPLELNLHEYNAATGADDFLWIAQDPNPSDRFFYDEHDDFRVISNSQITRTAISDPSFFTQVAVDFWREASVLVWINPNIVEVRKIRSFDPTTHSIGFDDLGSQAIYDDGRDQGYAVYNSIHVLDAEGEYCADESLNEDGTRTVYLWPRSTVALDERVTRSVRKFGIDVAGNCNLIIEGFEVRKHCGEELLDGVGIGSYTYGSVLKSGIVIRDNLVRHNRKGGSDRGYGGIHLRNAAECSVVRNTVIENPKHSGIFISTGRDIEVKENTVRRSGATSIRLYTVKHGEVTGNTIDESLGSHANGITLYMACTDILVANNRITRSTTPITLQDSGNLYIVNNFIDAGDRSGAAVISEWPDTSRGPWSRGVIAFLNNTLVRDDSNAAVSLGGLHPDNRYYLINNIADGGPVADGVIRHHNLYTGLAWNQAARYGWNFEEGEFLNETLTAVFLDPDGGDFSLSVDSPACGAGFDVSSIFPAALFPDYDISKDIAGRTRTAWDLGAFAR